MSEENFSDQVIDEKKFLQIKSIRTSSNAFLMKLKEGDIIIALDGEEIHQSYEDLSKELKEIKERKVLTLYREGVFFNTFVVGSLGVICEQVDYDKVTELNNLKLNDMFKPDVLYHQYELFKKPESIAILLNTSPTILASLAPPLWMIQNRLWTLFSITMLFYFFLFMISPWLFFIGWILKSWYVGNSQVDILRLFYRLGNYRLSSIFCAESEKEAQELSRKFDNKIDFYYSYLEPAILED
ncbi:PDZ domain-containing protein [Alphaproteobacteria bacterium]|nr:PDZ domain-containing protein [Alphaproteobacteria bacterium]